MSSCDPSLTCWYVYLIENRLGHWYCGVTTNIERRFAEHCADGPLTAKALKGKGPLRLVHVVTTLNKRTALQLEYWVKRQSKAGKRAWVTDSARCPFAHHVYTGMKFPYILR
ncbi:MAG: GIY-YIG nuclease family protein [Glaciecola sp.]|jgi:putative endonuclease